MRSTTRWFHPFALLRLLPLPLAVCWVTPAPALTSGESEDVFRSFTAHIQQQIGLDKVDFVEAQVCTEWFYKQRYQKPAAPPVQGVAFHEGPDPRHRALTPSDCPSRYPGGLEAARQDFSRTQSSLSLSLTFYEFALVGDRNDDEQYSAAELRDMLESFGLSFDTVLSPAMHLATLNAKFDALRKAGGLEALMLSMGTLYDKGYRFTGRDRVALNRVSG